ncbi:hypothetical protein OIU77_007619 [Salix suchowensis]|uniref:Uncharacterized protein n=1 Tax=Salix suchowensis TaxID=1278906 RepID=A0ABQ9AJ15_9ROSI|nr:hypothetical protein OIU77_007619 [Salix suchowensis]
MMRINFVSVSQQPNRVGRSKWKHCNLCTAF